MSDPYAEQIESDIASAREALASASAGIDKMRKELKALADKVAKCEVRDTTPPIPPSDSNIGHVI
jgi:phage shock protein A